MNEWSYARVEQGIAEKKGHTYSANIGLPATVPEKERKGSVWEPVER